MSALLIAALLTLSIPVSEAREPLLSVEVQRGGRSFVQGPNTPIEDGDQVAFWIRSPVSGEARLWNHGTAGDENPLYDETTGPPLVREEMPTRYPSTGWCDVLPPGGLERFTLTIRPLLPDEGAVAMAEAPVAALTDPGPITGIRYKSVRLGAAPRRLQAGVPVKVDFALQHSSALK